PVGDLQEFIVYQLPDVAGVEPAVGHTFRRQVGAFVIAHHDIGTLAEDLAVFGEFYFDVGDQRTHRPKIPVRDVHAVDADHGRGLRKPIAFEDRNTGGGKDADQ